MKNTHFKSVDIVKGIAIVMIILVHYNQSFVSNFSIFSFFSSGCQIFFVVSGFGSAISFSKKCDNNVSYKSASKVFYISRMISIAPAWYLMLLVIYIVNTFLLILTGNTIGFGNNRKPLAIICNLLFLNGLLPFCNNDVMPGGWYIGTAMLLYLITPLLYLLYKKAGGLKERRVLCFVLSALSVMIAILLTALFPEHKWFLYNNIVTQLPCFLMGMLMYFEIDEQFLPKRRAIIYAIAGIAVMVTAVKIFFNPFFCGSYILAAVLVGLSTYLILQYMIWYESEKRYGRIFDLLIRIGSKSLYVYLVHGFFVWGGVLIIKRSIDGIGLIGDSYIVFWCIMPGIIFLSYYSACILQGVVKKIKAAVLKNAAGGACE